MTLSSWVRELPACRPRWRLTSWGCGRSYSKKADLIGRRTVNSYGLIWVGLNHLAQAAGLDDRRDDVIAYMRFLSGGFLDEERMQTFVDRAPEAVKFFEASGIRFRVVRGLTDHYYGTAPGTRAVGRSLEVELISGFDLDDWRERVLTPHDVPSFVTAEEQVAWGGINNFSRWDQDIVRDRKQRDMRGKGTWSDLPFPERAAKPRRPHAHRPAGRTLGGRGRPRHRCDHAVGQAHRGAQGRDHWHRWLQRECANEPRLRADPRHRSGTRQSIAASLTGDGLVLGAEIGGVLHKNSKNSLRVMLSYTIPPEAPGQVGVCVHAGIVELCSPHTMVVNKYGNRFADETFFQGIVPQLRYFDPMRHEYPNLPAFLIFDSAIFEKILFRQPTGRQRGSRNGSARRTAARTCSQTRHRRRSARANGRTLQHLRADRN